MKRICLIVACLFTLCGCDKDAAYIDSINPPVITEDTLDTSTKSNINVKNTTIVKESSLRDFSAFDESGLSDGDYETAYAMCTAALLEYYKAVWNGVDMDLDTYMANENLKQYMAKKIESQYNLALKHNLTDNIVNSIDISVEKAELIRATDDYFYFNLATQVNKDIGSFGEPTEFLIQSLNGRLVIVDWYSNGKDSYDSILRGGNQTINNPSIWNDSIWANNLNTQ